MKKFVLLIVVAVLLSACGPSKAQIEKAIQETQSVQSTVVAGDGATRTTVKAGTATSEAKLSEVSTAQAATSEVMKSQTKTVTAATQEAQVALTATQEAYCGKEAAIVASEKLADIHDKLADKSRFAQNTARMYLAPVVDDIKAIKQEAEKLEVPQCVLAAKTMLVSSIGEMVEGLQDFVAQRDDDAANHFNSGTDYINQYNIEFAKLKQYNPAIVVEVKLVPTLTPQMTITPFPTPAPRTAATIEPAQPDTGHPAGTSGKCKDGTYTSAAHKQGACSHHGGVAEWWGN